MDGGTSVQLIHGFFESSRLCVLCCVVSLLFMFHNLVPRVAEKGKSPPGQRSAMPGLGDS